MSGTLPQENTHVHGAVTNIFTEDDFNEDFEELKSGGEATCFRAVSRGFGEVCVKRFHSIDLKTGLKRELEIFLKHSDHPNLIRFFGFYENNQRVAQRIGYVMEYMPGGSLDDVIYSKTQYTFARACNWMAQAGRGLEYLHKARIIHRDVKPRNMLLDRHLETLKLSDFGLSKNMNNTTFNSNSGTYPYMAPEVLDCGDGNVYSYPSDVFSLGITFWELLHRRAPYAEKGYILIGKVVNGERPVFDASIGPNTRSLLQRSWSHAPNSRCSVMEMINFASQRGTIQYSQPSRQQPAPAHSYSQPNIPQASQPQTVRAATVPQTAKVERTLRLQGPSNNHFIPKSARTMMSQMAHELIAFLFPLCPHKFQAATQLMFAHALEFEQHLNNPMSLICYKPFNVLVFMPDGQILKDVEAEKLATAAVLIDHPEMAQSWDYNAFNWARKKLFFVVYLTKNVNQCSPVKIDIFKKLLLQLEQTYNNRQQEVRTFMSRKKFNCLIVGDWKLARKLFDRVKAGHENGEEDNMMTLYDMNYHFYGVSKKSCLAHAAKEITEKIAEIGEVHKIIYLVDARYDLQFNSNWQHLLKSINATVWLILEIEQGTDQAQREMKEKQDFVNCTNFPGETIEVYVMFTDKNGTVSRDFMHMFSWNYADCINKLVFEVPPLRAIAE